MYVLTNDGEVIFYKDKKIDTIDWKGKTLYVAFRHLHGGGVNVHYYDSIIAQSDSLGTIIELALQYYREHPDLHERFMTVLDGIWANGRKKGLTLEYLMRARITEYIESEKGMLL